MTTEPSKDPIPYRRDLRKKMNLDNGSFMNNNNNKEDNDSTTNQS
jgi:hypothetical protein